MVDRLPPSVRLIAATLVIGFGLSAAGGVPTAHADPAAPRATAPAMSAEARALAQAKETGQPVEILDRTTETEKVFANPTGTFTLEQSAGPARVRRDGDWVPVDTTLERRPDGTIAPLAAAVTMSFSGGGRAHPMARISDGGRSLALRWPGPLPTPQLSGDTATYPEVLPGVDLKVRAQAEAFSEVLVVKTPAAAEQAVLRRLRFGAEVTGASLQAADGGGFKAVDAAGTTIFTSPTPIMWDSTGATASPSARSADEVESETGEGRERGPRNGDQSAAMAVEVASDAVTVIPDTELVREAQYPLYLDPSVHAARLTARAMVNASHPNTPTYNWGSHEGMGHVNTAQDGRHTKRLYFSFDTRAIKARTILSARFSAYEVWAFNCSPSPVIVGLTGGFNASTTWNRQPTWIRQMGPARSYAYGRDGCHPRGNWVEFDVLGGAKDAAKGGWASTSFMMRAVNESTNAGWKRFRSDGAFTARLSIEYNTPPAIPAVRTTGPVTTCVSGAARPVINADPPTLVARVNDLDATQSVTAYFELWVTYGSRIGQPIATPPKKPNVDYQVDLPELAAGTYSWRVVAYDGHQWSPYTRWCEFTVDPTKPASPTATAPPDQTYEVGRSATFTFGNGGSADVVKYKWSFNDVTTSADVSATAPTVTVPLRHFGPAVLRVWSFDKAGNRSEHPGALEFTVKGEAAAGHWRLDENTGNSASDAMVPAHPMTISGGTRWTDGRWAEDDPTDRALAFDGTNGAASTASAEIIRTDQNFAAAAWVRMPTLTTTRVVMSQGNAVTSGFVLRAVPAGIDEEGLPRTVFEFAVPHPTAAGQEAVAKTTDMVVLPGEWVHVVGVYEAGAKLMSIYVDGEAADDPLEVAISPANEIAPIRIGRAQGASASPASWLGDVDDARVFPGALDAEQVRLVYRDSRPK